MAQDLNQEVLIARNNETGQVGAVTGLNEDGTPKMTDVKSAKLSDLVKFQKGQNPVEAFLSNFVRQCQNPTTFGFFRVPADRYDTVGTVIGDFAKDPVANAEMLKNNKVELPTAEQKVEQPQQAATPTEQPAQGGEALYHRREQNRLGKPQEEMGHRPRRFGKERRPEGDALQPQVEARHRDTDIRRGEIPDRRPPLVQD